MPIESSLPRPPVSSLLPPPLRPKRTPPPRRWWRRLHIALLTLAIPAGTVFGIEGAGGILALFVLIVPLEKLSRRHDQPIRRTGLRTDLTYALAAPVLYVATVVAGVVVALVVFPLWLPALLLRPIVMSQPSWLMAVEAFILIDVLVYWTHRLYHEVGFLWRFHSIHHSSVRLDWISGIRNHPFDGALIIVPEAKLDPHQLLGVPAALGSHLGHLLHAGRPSPRGVRARRPDAAEHARPAPRTVPSRHADALPVPAGVAPTVASAEPLPPTDTRGFVA